jgi:hypothetical protein
MPDYHKNEHMGTVKFLAIKCRKGLTGLAKFLSFNNLFEHFTSRLRQATVLALMI